MRKLSNYVLGLVLAFVLGSAALVGAQNINKALQLSQDATGAFGVDTNNNVYFPKHILGSGTAPVLTSCGTTPAILGTDIAGEVTEGTTSTGCLITFNVAYLAKPWCVVAAQSFTTSSPISWTPYTTGIGVTHSNQTTGVAYNYFCSGRT